MVTIRRRPQATRSQLLRSRFLREPLFGSCRNRPGSRPAGKCQREGRGRCQPIQAPATGADGGKAYRDPFDPDFWTKQVEVTHADKAEPAAADERRPADQRPEATRTGEAQRLSSPQPRRSERAAAAGEDERRSWLKPETNSGARPTKPRLTENAGQQQRMRYTELAERAETGRGAAAGDRQADQRYCRQACGGFDRHCMPRAACCVSIWPTRADSSDVQYRLGRSAPRKWCWRWRRSATILKEPAVAQSSSAAIRTAASTRAPQNENWRLSMDRAQSSLLHACARRAGREAHLPGFRLCRPAAEVGRLIRSTRPTAASKSWFRRIKDSRMARRQHRYVGFCWLSPWRSLSPAVSQCG